MKISKPAKNVIEKIEHELFLTQNDLEKNLVFDVKKRLDIIQYYIDKINGK